jgi:hypothetical protein
MVIAYPKSRSGSEQAESTLDQISSLTAPNSSPWPKGLHELLMGFVSMILFFRPRVASKTPPSSPPCKEDKHTKSRHRHWFTDASVLQATFPTGSFPIRDPSVDFVFRLVGSQKYSPPHPPSPSFPSANGYFRTIALPPSLDSLVGDSAPFVGECRYQLKGFSSFGERNSIAYVYAKATHHFRKSPLLSSSSPKLSPKHSISV